MNHFAMKSLCAAVFCLGLAPAALPWTDPPGAVSPAIAPKQDLSGLSIEELTHVEVQAAGRKDQKLAQVAAAVFVITAEDIRRSGASNIPDLLRMVPGIQVAQISTGIWAISSRGFNGRLANKMLVMIDGRSVYNSVFSGTLWNENMVPFQQIERIEVIRGPGATLWGPNAVDGVISIVTRKARDTQGLFISTEAGVSSMPDTDLQYGGRRGDRIQYRLEAGFAEHSGSLYQSGAVAPDRWNFGHGSLRVDWQPTDRDLVSFDGGANQGGGHEIQVATFPLPSSLTAVTPLAFSGGYAMGRWQRQLKKSEIALAVYLNRENRSEYGALGNLSTADVDFQDRMHLGSRNDFIWGIGYRWRGDVTDGISAHPRFDETLYSVFAQDELAIIPNRLTLTLGTRVQEYRTTVGNNFDVQPQVRLAWSRSKRESFWGAVSRAVRSPSQIERDLQLAYQLPPENGLPTTFLSLPNPHAEPEVVLAYEAGYRRQIGKRLSTDVAFYLDRRSNIIGLASEPPAVSYSPQPQLILTEKYNNIARGTTRGVEISTNWNPLRSLRFQASFAREDAALSALTGITPESPVEKLWRTPRNNSGLRTSWDINRHWSADSFFSYVSRIPEYEVPSYTRTDIRVARKMSKGSEISAGVRNLSNSKHLEFITDDYHATLLVRRDFYVRTLWRF